MKPDLASKEIYIIKASKLSFFVGRTFHTQGWIKEYAPERCLLKAGQKCSVCMFLGSKGLLTLSLLVSCASISESTVNSLPNLYQVFQTRGAGPQSGFFTGRCDPARKRTKTSLWVGGLLGCLRLHHNCFEKHGYFLSLSIAQSLQWTLQGPRVSVLFINSIISVKRL